MDTPRGHAGTTALEDLRRSDSLHRTLTASLPDTSMFLVDRDMRILIAEGEGVRALPGVDEDMFRGSSSSPARGSRSR